MTDAVIQQAWDALSADLLAWFRRRTDPATAEDLRQETFVRLMTGLPELDDDERVAAYAFRTARNLLIDHHRRQRPSAALDPERHAHERDALPDERISAEVARWLPGFIATLDPPTRAALELAELQGLTQLQVAERLGLSLSGAKSRVQRGRRKLRDTLLSCCAVELDRRGQITGYTPRRECGC